MSVIETYIRQIDLFQNLDSKYLRSLANICRTTEYSKKELLFLEGETGRALFFCVSGRIQLYKITPEGREVVVKLIGPGETFAEVVLFEQKKYPVSAVALRKSRSLIIPRDDFHDLLDDTGFRENFIQMLIQKQRYLVERIRMLSLQDIEDRLFYYLKQHYGDSPEITPGLSKKDIAAAIGTVPETLSRVLNRLKLAGNLSWEGDLIKINPKWRI